MWLIDYFFHGAKWHKFKNTTSKDMYKGRNVIVRFNRNSGSEIAAGIMYEAPNGNFVFRGTVGAKKDKVIAVCGNDEWFPEYYYYKYQK